MADFRVHQRDGEGVSVIDLKGYLDAHTAPDLENAFQSLWPDCSAAAALPHGNQLQSGA